MLDTLQILTIVLSGAAVASVVLALYALGVNNTVKKRLTQIVRQRWARVDTNVSRKPTPKRVATVINILSKISLPEDGWQNSSVRIRFVQAGIRNNNAPQYYYAVKTLLTLVLPVVLFLILRFSQSKPSIPLLFLFLLFTAAAGYYLPEMVMRFITNKRIERMRNSLPDFMELMVVCTESGMSIDAAIARISQEMAHVNPDLAQEFYLSGLEMRAGATRIEALRNLALRTSLEDLHDLVTMLLQADKFGTSMAESLRVQSETMRLRRIQRAEELAAKIPVKLVLPLGLFIFPTLLIVMLGPAMITAIEMLKRK
ncbi:MAG: type II secretion system F family protein [Chlorobaculum sp.]